MPVNSNGRRSYFINIFSNGKTVVAINIPRITPPTIIIFTRLPRLPVSGVPAPHQHHTRMHTLCSFAFVPLNYTEYTGYGALVFIVSTKYRYTYITMLPRCPRPNARRAQRLNVMAKPIDCLGACVFPVNFSGFSLFGLRFETDPTLIRNRVKAFC